MASPRSIGFGAEGAEEPESVGAYRLESVLGAGGMGVVHLATSPSGMRLAVKVVHAQHAADPEFRARFRQEVSAARRVSGAFTASVVDADPEADRPWMATVHIPGPTLAERVRDSGPLTAEEVRLPGPGSPRRCATSTGPGWCTATSSRATCCSPPTDPRSSTSGFRVRTTVICGPRPAS